MHKKSACLFLSFLVSLLFLNKLFKMEHLFALDKKIALFIMLKGQCGVMVESDGNTVQFTNRFNGLKWSLSKDTNTDGAASIKSIFVKSLEILRHPVKRKYWVIMFKKS
uniref:Uncharacterized protein n=1 Tax=Romanomermis culicivorax TaxID=13658 RepID=A0A915I369_ROMCU